LNSNRRKTFTRVVVQGTVDDKFVSFSAFISRLFLGRCFPTSLLILCQFFGTFGPQAPRGRHLETPMVALIDPVEFLSFAVQLLDGIC